MSGPSGSGPSGFGQGAFGGRVLTGSSHRRATVLIFVVAILGVLFVSGIAFLTTINFEAKTLRIEQQARDDATAVSQIQDIIEKALADGFVSAPGQTGGTKTMSEFRPAPMQDSTLDRVRIHPLTWAELPGVHGILSPVEPFFDPSNQFVFRLPSDFALVRSRLISRNSILDRGAVDTFLRDQIGGFDGDDPFLHNDDPWDGLAVDTDGDGVSDAFQYRFLPGDLSEDQLENLSRVVNAPDNLLGEVYLGFRVTPHGAMVNLNDSHPNLLRTVLNYDGPWPSIEQTNAGDLRHGPYMPETEEHLLRRRNIFPPAEMAISAIHGNPADLASNDPPGGGDFGDKMFPSISSYFQGGESVFKDQHQYWPISRDPQFDEYDLWQQRMYPPTGNVYDRRHRVTSVSHDDLIMRGAAVDVYALNQAGELVSLNRGVDVFDLMRQAALEQDCGGSANGYDGLRMDFLDYPHTVHSARRLLNDLPDPLAAASPTSDVSDLYTDGGPAISWCECEEDSFQSNCQADSRKGRLRLSLPWLDTHMTATTPRTVGKPITEAMRDNLIYEAFEMMLLGARPQPGPNMNSGWGGFQELDVAGGGTELLWVRTPAQFKNISRTAAMLTANMIDFMDADDKPTRIAVRNFELNRDAWDASLHAGMSWAEAIGKPYSPEEFVYGLEHQPYITEVSAYVKEDAASPGQIDPATSGFAVELFNPNEVDIGIGAARYLLRFPNAVDVFLTQDILAKGYSVLYVDPQTRFGLSSSQGFEDLTGTSDAFSFKNGETIYLIRRETYPTNAGNVEVDIVLDEFLIADDRIPPEFGALVDFDPGDPQAEAPVWTLERRGVAGVPNFASRVGPWYAPYPADPADAFSDATDPHSLGDDNAVFGDNKQYPVEVYMADTGSFASAFPTTGSMLLLMRFANQHFSGAPGRAFTTHMEEDFDPAGGGGIGAYALDNGRMPVFDMLNLHHVPPAEGESVDPWQSSIGDDDWEVYRPGEPMHLPWGQLVFDFFTALPLSNEGPYRDLGPTGPNWQVDEAAQARVDQGGLRVHGRININAAPWTVMQGLPYIPLDRFQYTGLNDPIFKAFKSILDPNDTLGDNRAGVLGKTRAMAIAAYRDVRNVIDIEGGGQTKDYGSGGTSRGWDDLDDVGGADPPEFRRGTGFVTVGELANVRHEDAARGFRMDHGMTTTPTGESPYLEAIAVLASLGDWVTVRSHVFTVYGTVRGGTEPDPDGLPANILDNLGDVNGRAIRFEKTVDRLPLFLRTGAMETIGGSSIARYSDVLND